MTLILDPAEMRQLDRLRLNPRKAFSGRIRGERLTRKKGISIEFADYREYTEGDDLRHLDWNVLARLDTPVMRTYQDEEDLAVYILVDASPSMDFGDPTKLSAAKRFACAFASIALTGGDAVLGHAIGYRAPPPRALRGRVGYPKFARWIAEVPVASASDPGLADALKTFAASRARSGLVILLSDGMDPTVFDGLRIVAGRGHDIQFLQILSDVELDPDLEGDLKLLDAEGGSAVEITANSYALREYRRRLTEHNASIVETMRRIGGRHALVRPELSVSDLVRTVLRREEWVLA